jgi:hypothetical protein
MGFGMPRDRPRREQNQEIRIRMAIDSHHPDRKDVGTMLQSQ